MAAEYEPFFSGVPELSGKADLKTVGFDARFPNCNQTKNCWQNYVDFYRCLKIKASSFRLSSFIFMKFAAFREEKR